MSATTAYSSKRGDTMLARRRTFITPEQRRSMVAEAVYYFSEHRGFAAGYELNDWLAGEDQIAATFSMRDA
ncbi:MAG: DUF2934 domain-containing protein [Gammaproteobacteria bacterium]